MSPAQKFLQRVEQTGMVSEPLLAELRRRVSETHRNMRPEMLAKLLVDRGELTAAQARKLVASTIQPVTPPEPDPEPEPEPDLTLAEDKQELDFLDDDDDDEYALQPLGETSSAPTDELDLAEVDDTPEAILVEDTDDLLADTPPTTPTPTPPPKLPVPESPPAVAERPAAAKDLLADKLLGDPLMHADTAESRRLVRRRSGLGGFLGELVTPLRPRKNRWDSPLILLGGGSLILLIAAGFSLFALFYSENAEEIFTAGQDAYSRQSYSSAAAYFERFDASFPSHEKASLARVRIQMCNVRQITDGSKNWEKALDVASTSLPQIKQEAAFDEARGELAKLLPDIAEGLVELAKVGSSADEQERLIQLATAARELVDNPEYLPTSVRKSQEQRILAIDESMSVVRRTISRDRELSQTLAEIRVAADSGKITTAYQLRDTLLSQFPILADNTALLDTLALVATKEREGVVVGASDLQANTDDHPATASLAVVLSDHRGATLKRSDDDIVCVLANAAVYGIRVANGEVLWRRFVGFDTNVFPQTIGNELASDVLLVDASHSELQRIDTRSGKLVWRLPCPSPIFTPQLNGDRALLCCGRETDSRLVTVDLATGQPGQAVAFPVGCVQAPQLFQSVSKVVQIGNHSSVYILDAATLAAEYVIPLGHERSSIMTHPTVVGSTLVIAVNQSGLVSHLHVYSLGADGAWMQSHAPLPLQGHVISDPVVDEQRLLVTTDLGEIYVFETAVDRAGLREVARVPSGGDHVGPTFAILDRSNLWIANRTFGRYELQATRAAIVTKWVRDRQDRFLHPLSRHGEHLIHVRTRLGMQGATVAAVAVNRSNRDGAPVWETDVGVPSIITVNSQGAVHAATVNGAMFRVDAAAVRAGISKQPSARIDPRLLARGLSQHVSINQDLSLFAPPPPIKHMFASDLQLGDLRRVPLRITPDISSAPLVAFRDGVLAACDTGPIHLLSVSGNVTIDPFMPRLEAGKRIQWLTPAATGDDTFLAAERSGRVYHVSCAADRMRLVAEHNIEGEFKAGLAAHDSVVYAATTSGRQAAIVPIYPGDLSLGKPLLLEGSLTWGPQRVGRYVLAIDDQQKAYAFSGNGELLWTTSQPIGPVAGSPLDMNGKLVFASTSGTLSTVDEQGAVVAQGQVSEPLGSGPVSFNGRLLVAGWDGTLYLVSVPQ